MDAVTGNFELYSRNVLYTYLEVQSIETPLTVRRVDVGTQVPIKFKVVLAHDKRPIQSGRIYVGDLEAKFLGDGWFEVIVSSGSVGRFLYQPTRAEVILNTNVGSGKLTKIKLSGADPIEIIFDKIKIQLTALKERIDVGSEAPIIVKAWYEYDKTSFQGKVYFNEPLRFDKVGAITYFVARIEDRLYGLKAFETNSVRIIFDKVIVTLKSDAERIDIGTEAPIRIYAKYAFDNSPFIGKLYLSTDKKQDRVGLYKYAVIRIEDELYGLKVFETNEVQIIFDMVVVELKSPSERIEVGKRAKISYNAYYSYDKSPFEGEILLNHDLITYDVKRVTYTVTKIIDYKYGLKTFKSNSLTVTFDKVLSTLEVNTIIPFTVKVVFKAYYESDKSPVVSGLLTINSYSRHSERLYSGTYIIDYLDVLPATRLVGKFKVEGFDEIKIDAFIVHLGNTAVYLLMIVCAAIFIVYKRTTHRGQEIISCPQCGSIEYMGVKVAPKLWIYECIRCGKRWQMKKQ
jgi:DNA-directed RNA polymerase subunit RPC12/RpoP